MIRVKWSSSLTIQAMAGWSLLSLFIPFPNSETEIESASPYFKIEKEGKGGVGRTRGSRPMKRGLKNHKIISHWEYLMLRVGIEQFELIIFDWSGCIDRDVPFLFVSVSRRSLFLTDFIGAQRYFYPGQSNPYLWCLAWVFHFTFMPGGALATYEFPLWTSYPCFCCFCCCFFFR